jgi:peptidoglycan hydrolase CwlO-like protein
LGEHEEESSQKITELEALCKKLMEDTHWLQEEKATLEGIVKSHDELLMEVARETGLNHMGKDEDDEEEEEDAAAPHAATPEEIDEEGPVEVIPEQEAPVSHEVIPADAEPLVPHLCLYHALMRDYEEILLRLEDDFDDLDDDPSKDHSDIDE